MLAFYLFLVFVLPHGCFYFRCGYFRYSNLAGPSQAFELEAAQWVKCLLAKVTFHQPIWAFFDHDVIRTWLSKSLFMGCNLLDLQGWRSSCFISHPLLHFGYSISMGASFNLHLQSIAGPSLRFNLCIWYPCTANVSACKGYGQNMNLPYSCLNLCTSIWGAKTRVWKGSWYIVHSL